MNETTARTCKKCSTEKPISEFSPYDDKGIMRHRHECRACVRQRQRGYFDRTKPERLRRARDKYNADPFAYWTAERRARARELERVRGAQLRDEVFSHYGCECVACGETEPLFLTLDHIENDGKEWRKVHNTGVSLYRWIKKHQYPAIFQTLCMNCNFGKARNAGVLVKDRRISKEGSTTIPKGSRAKRPEVPSPSN